MVTILGFAILALLVVIALELYLVSVGLARLPGIIAAKDDKKDTPTINVNVGTVAQPESSAARPAAGQSGSEASVPPAATSVAAANAQAMPPAPENQPRPATAVPEAEAPPPRSPPPPPPKARSLQSTASGQTVAKCPKCQAENSTYRQECFNCGNPIHPAN